MRAIRIIMLVCAMLACDVALANLASGNAESSMEDAVEESRNFYDFKFIVGGGYVSQLYLGGESGLIPVLALTFDGEYNNFFVESNQKNRLSGVLGRGYLGYHLWQDETSRVDLVGGNYTPAIEKDNEHGNPIPELINLNRRKDDFDLGLRYVHFSNETYFSIETAYDLADLSHNSWLLETYIGKANSIGNWDISYGLVHSWYSNKITNYYVGVLPSELAPGLVEYSTGASYTLGLELSAQYPLSQNWVLETGFSYSHLSKNIAQSPLVANDNVQTFLLGFAYVF